MPQFDTSNFLPQMFWLAISFAMLYAVVRLTLPKIGRVVEERGKVIGADLGAAEAARSETTSVSKLYDESLGSARSDALGIVAEAKAAASRATEARMSAVSADIEVRLAAADQRIAAARAAAITELDSVAAGAVGDIVERLTGSRPDDKAVKAALSAA